jgi:hypothetical protein
MRRSVLFLALALVLLLGVIQWWSRPRPPLSSDPSTQNVSPRPHVSQTSPPQAPVGPLIYKVPTKGEYQGKSDPRWAWWRRMENLDPRFEWKMPISFYGKVVDQDGQPVAAARIRYGWNAASGSNERFAQSDSHGMFSIEGINGKVLSVRVQKHGYYASKDGFGAFEYAAFFEPHYHEPDPYKPVVFQLQKKQQVAPLVRTEQEIRLPERGPAVRVPLDDRTSLELSLLANNMKPDQPWSMRIATDSAGLQTATDEFPVEAPTDGYQSSVILDRKSPKPGGWSGLYQGGVLYFKTAQGYGRVEIKMLAGDDEARVTTYLNASGSRNLQADDSGDQDGS